MPDWLTNVFNWLDDTHAWINTLASIVAIVTLPFLVKQLRDASRQETIVANTTRAQFLLDLRALTHNYQRAHCNLRPGGKWNASLELPDTIEDWCLVETYMGMFEHVEQLLADGLISRDEFRDLFEYRLNNILSNPKIFKYKLHDKREGWTRFLKLLKTLNKTVPPPRQDVSPFVR